MALRPLHNFTPWLEGSLQQFAQASFKQTEASRNW